MGKDDPPYFKSLRPSKTSPNWALHTYLANRWEYPTLWTIFFFHRFIGYSSCNIQYKSIIQKKKKRKKRSRNPKGVGATSYARHRPWLSLHNLLTSYWFAYTQQMFLSPFFPLSSQCHHWCVWKSRELGMIKGWFLTLLFSWLQEKNPHRIYRNYVKIISSNEDNGAVYLISESCLQAPAPIFKVRWEKLHSVSSLFVLSS